jgi:hypothetical protein
MLEKIISVILNYVIAPFFLMSQIIWNGIKKLIIDIFKHLYNKYIIPVLAVILVIIIFKLIHH